MSNFRIRESCGEYSWEFMDSPAYDPDADLQRSTPPRCKSRYPYAYDPYTIWREVGKVDSSDYTDRLAQWDRKRYDLLAREIYAGNRPFDNHNCRGDLIEQFLQEYYKNPMIRLRRVIEYCDWSSGYPTWRLDYAKEGA